MAKKAEEMEGADEFKLSDDVLFGVDESVAGMATGQSTLPVPAPLFYVVNGAGTPMPDAPAIQFGGWACDVEAMLSVLDLTERDLPAGLVEISTFARNGTELKTYTSRSLVVAPVAVRSSWVDRDSGQRSPKFFEGGRRHVQMLVILGSKGKDGLKVWGPAILSAKGFQAKNLLDSVDSWAKHLQPVLTEIGTKAKPNLFWMAVGTFGEYKVEMVGSGKAKSPITPIGPYLLKVDKSVLTSIFGGEALGQAIVDLYKVAEDWRVAWNEGLSEQVQPDGKVKLKRGNDSGAAFDPPY